MQNEIVKLLLSNGIIISLKTHLLNPLFTAVSYNNYGAVKLLLDIGIDKSIEYSNPYMRNMSVIKLAQMGRKEEIIKLLEKY